MSDFYIPPLPDDFADKVMQKIMDQKAIAIRNKISHAKRSRDRKNGKPNSTQCVGKQCEDYDVRVGDLIRWVISYAVFAADDRGYVYPVTPIYERGIVVEISYIDPCLVCAYVSSGEFGSGHRLVDISDCLEFDILSRNEEFVE